MFIADDESFETTGVVPCPACDMHMCHPVGVQVNAGGDIHEITHYGYKASKGKAVARGVAIQLAFDCECGHSFTQMFHFHKGSTYSGVVKSRQRDEGGECRAETIWRD